MKIEILGPGCSKCRATEKIVKKVVSELGIDAEVKKIEDLQDIIDRGVIMTPAVIVDGKVKIEGRKPSIDEIKEILN
jgi:small redox-active disulfide protein 2